MQAGDGDTSWNRFLRSLTTPQGVIELWQALERFGGDVPPPYSAATESGGLSMTWDRGRHHFEIEVLTNGTYDWFYMDRDSQARAGAEARPLGSYGPEMFSYLRRTLEGTWRS